MRVFTRFYVLYCVVGLAWINKNLVESWRKTPAAVSQYRKSSYFNSLQLRHHKDNQQLDQVDNTYFTQIRRDLSRFVQYGSGALLFAQSVVAAGTPVSPRITQKAYIDIKIANYTEESTGTNRGAKGSGRIVFGLYGDIAPRSVQSFLDTVRSDGEEDPSYYNSIFSRISPDGVLEIEKVRGVNTVTIAGSEQLEYNGKLLSPAPPLETSTIKHFKKGLLTRNALSSGLEFGITTKASAELDSFHVVFGEVLEGMEVLDSVLEIPVYTYTAKTGFGSTTKGADSAITDTWFAKQKEFYVSAGKAFGDQRAIDRRGKLLRRVTVIGAGVLN